MDGFYTRCREGPFSNCCKIAISLVMPGQRRDKKSPAEAGDSVNLSNGNLETLQLCNLEILAF